MTQIAEPPGPTRVRAVPGTVKARAKRLLARLGVSPFRPRVLAAWALAACAAVVLLFFTLGALTYFLYARGLKPPDQAIAERLGTSVAYDRTGQNELYAYTNPFGGLREPKPLNEMSPYLIAATVATEDPSFFSNPGVNFTGVARAAFENLTPFGPGFFEGSGGSSISQQLARNVYLSTEERLDRRAQRKLKETVIALELKRRYSDEQILEWYLNVIYYGNFAYGAETAARTYFGKSARDLTLGEATLLAGLPQAPNDYAPSIEANRERAKARQNTVLDLMAEHAGDIKNIVEITPEQIEAARSEPLNYVESKHPIVAPHFVFFVDDQVKKMCAAGLFEPPGDIPCESVVGEGSLRITTSLDLGLNDLAQKALEEEIAKGEAGHNGHDGAIVAIKPETGEVLAYVGSRDFWRDDIAGQVDIASSLRSHGSTMKMFTYLTAFEQGWVPSTFVEDKPLKVPDANGAERQVNNWNASYLGRITARKALSESVNTAAVRTVMDVGVDKMRETAHRIGITDLQQEDCGPTITLGACEIKLIDMTYAFSALAMNGVMRGRPTSEDLPDGFRELDPVSVLKIEDGAGNVLYEYAKPEERAVADPAYAYMLTHVLSNDATRWSRLTIDRPAAAKTGTSEEFRDNLVMGYTRDLALGVWMGNADNTPMAPGTFSSAGVGPLWARFMTEAHKHLNLAPRPFEKPESVIVSRCAGREELFKKDQKPSKPGACRGPGGEPASPPSPTSPTPPPAEPTLIPTVVPTVIEPISTATPEPLTPPPPPTEVPSDTPTLSPEPSATSPSGQD